MRYPLTGATWIVIGACLVLGSLFSGDPGLIASAVVVGVPIAWYGRRLYRGRPLFPKFAGISAPHVGSKR